MNLKRFISLVVSVAILFFIYAKIDLVNLMAVWRNCDLGILAIALLMVIPITITTAWRLQQLVPRDSLSLWEANRLILGASVLNMVLPSKMGDLAKAYFMAEGSDLSLSLAIAISIFEKACDLLSLLLWCVFGLILYPAKDSLFWIMTVGIASGLVLGILLLSSQRFANLFFNSATKFAPKSIKTKLEKMQSAWAEMHGLFWHNKQNLLLVTITSVFIWFLHLLQIWLFILALKAVVPLIVSLALSPLSILAGLLPLTFAGIGTRDAAIIYFYQDYFNEATGAALGFLCTSRYFMPAVVGLPFLGQMMAFKQGTRKEDKKIY
ncbi:flippase-like domain-containing protein [Waterburya agarophytonicola K14]|uniref:Flippase-like domain-containing protein n=1 Tax=Waterburya agarophytonicola KI4 TaxID=2874699 RepID=A0A964BNS4_9CYAN|nr:lysylphosphatidylglycerol synthase transmembrane domain-containing protein [Waterburya agarophytonicola]MCC0176092.1 flippase-like domain-containing protein [Waterburya agarophytonicola KI4]